MTIYFGDERFKTTNIQNSHRPIHIHFSIFQSIASRHDVSFCGFFRKCRPSFTVKYCFVGPFGVWPSRICHHGVVKEELPYRLRDVCASSVKATRQFAKYLLELERAKSMSQSVADIDTRKIAEVECKLIKFLRLIL